MSMFLSPDKCREAMGMRTISRSEVAADWPAPDGPLETSSPRTSGPGDRLEQIARHLDRARRFLRERDYDQAFDRAASAADEAATILMLYPDGTPLRRKAIALGEEAVSLLIASITQVRP